jgi:two-component system sensor histidine kinase DegS
MNPMRPTDPNGADPRPAEPTGTEPTNPNPTQPDWPDSDRLDTYTRPQMESRTFGREVHLDAAGRPTHQSVSQAAEEIRGLVQALIEGGSDTTSDDVMGHLSMALLEAQEQERSRLAEELHDGPAQALANAIFQTEILERAIREDPALADAELASLRQILERELDTLRGYINQLRPSLREAEGLDDALRDSAAAVSQRSGLPVEVTIGASATDLHEAARTVVLRVAQEALRNIAKHSGASRAWLMTRSIDEAGGGRKWQLEVGDDGQGFDIDGVTANPNRRHFGLRFMRERADLLGSELSITTNPAAGTVVRLTTDIGG